MVARSTPPLRDVSSQSESDSNALDADSTHAPVEPVRPSDAQRQQVLALAPSPRALALVGVGVASALAGGAVGYWLGARGKRRSARSVQHLASTIDSAVKLAPVAMGLLGNPLIRTIALRLLARQISRRIGS
jgi:hypothetical protein